MAAADAAEAVIAQMPVEPLPIVADAVVDPPPMVPVVVVEPPPVAADAVETVVAPPPVAADAAAAPVTGVPPPPPPPPPEQKIQSVAAGGEEPLPSEIHMYSQVIESIEAQLPSLADDQKPCDLVTDVKENGTNIARWYYLQIIQKQPEETVQPSGHLLVEQQPAMVVNDNNSKESEKQAPTQPCPSSQHQIPVLGCAGNEERQDVPPMSTSMVLIDNRPSSSANFLDTDDLSDDSPTRNSNDNSDHSDGGYCYDPICHFRDPYCRLTHGRRRMDFEYSCICNARRSRWPGDCSFIPGFFNPCNPMASRDTESWSRWPSPEPDHGKKRYNVTCADIGRPSRWSSPEPDCGKKSVGAGLSNPNRWTCFLNCILQCMVHTVPLVLKLRTADHPDPCPRASIGFCCFCSLKLHADESMRLSGSAFYPESFVNHLKSISSNFESGVQQDAQEFLCDLLEKLDGASVAPRSSVEESSSTEKGGIAKEIFGGHLKSQLRCPACNRCSDKSEPFVDLSLEVTMVDSLMDALQSFTKVELIEDYMCDGCKSRVNMEKHFKVEQAPEVLVIHLKRFTNSGGKIWDKVKYPLELDINSFKNSSDDTPQKYDLYGVVVHHGIYGRGHYVCYIRSSASDWYEFNDDKIRRFSEASALDSAAYLLFYVKKGSSPWFSTLLEKEDKIPQDGSVSLAEQGTSEIALFNNKEEESMSSHGQDNSGYCLVGPAEENGDGPSVPDFSQDIQRNGNGNSLSDAADKLAEGCCLSGISGGTQELSCLTGSDDKNGHADGFLEPCEKEDISPNGSLDTNEMNLSTHGSSEVDLTVTQGGSPPKSDDICSLLQLSDKYDDKPWEKEDVNPRESLDTMEKNPSTHGSSEVDPTVTQGGSPPKSESIRLLQQSHKYDDNCHCRNSSQEDETWGCSGAPSMGMCTSENETVESKSNHELGNSEDGASKGKLQTALVS